MATARTPAPDWASGVRAVPFIRQSAAGLSETNRALGLGFSPVELARIRTYYRAEKRDPTDVELAGLAQSWSEHCSYKSSRPWLKRAFAGLRPKPRVLGTGDAGVMAFENGYAYALRIESHNHPSAVEPYGGAATGIGGILRDVLAVGAKPIAVADPLFFGPLDLPPEAVPKGVKSPRYLLGGVVAGIRDYGNRVGVPNVSGSISFDPAYTVNPLVNVACVGFLPRSRLRPNRARATGDRLVLVGGLTGRDGIGGVAFASQELTERSEEESRGAVQLGNPIMKEPLIHACLESFDAGLVEGLKDLGGGGLATASGELVHAGGLGLRIDLDRVPLREGGLKPWEVWISESQERMILDVRPRHLDRVLAIFRKHDVPATEVGVVTAGPFEELRWHGRPAAHLRLSFRVDPPLLHRPRRTRRPPAFRAVDPGEPALPLFEELVTAPDSVSRESVIRVYDHEVQGHTMLKSLHGRPESPSHGDAAVLRPRVSGEKGLAVATASQPWACREDPYHGGVWVVEEAARNLIAVGARPDALTDCLNFGNPEDPSVMGDFAQVVRGLADAARALDLAVPSGNVSFYNGGLGASIPPTPVVLATGILDSAADAVTSDLKVPGNSLYLVGRSAPHLGGSLWARRRGRSGLAVPPTDPTELRHIGERLRVAIHAGDVVAAHDVSDGGLAVTLAEMAFGGGVGFAVDLAATTLPSPALALAAEGSSRWVVEVSEDRRSRFEGRFTPGSSVRVGAVIEPPVGGLRFAGDDLGQVDLPPLYERWRAGLGVP
ncbi:MAG TPA: phosphoribosylformylglycinamidine synthase subunit PurL [Thermoplasmata archaeon]|nr:phosphoribosylformylglycinamidine synthase subunit PurL [Thermoplasmata archaeon]